MEQNTFITLVGNAIDAFEKQGKFSKIGNHDGCAASCLYKGGDNVCCIVGHMMPNDEVRNDADTESQSSIRSLYENGFKWAAQFAPTQIDLLQQLQYIHDEDLIEFDDAVQKMRKQFKTYVEGLK